VSIQATFARVRRRFRKTEALYKRYKGHSMSPETWFVRGVPIIEHSNQNTRRCLTENVSGPPSALVVCYPVQSYGQSESDICEKKKKKLHTRRRLSVTVYKTIEEGRCWYTKTSCEQHVGCVSQSEKRAGAIPIKSYGPLIFRIGCKTNIWVRDSSLSPRNHRNRAFYGLAGARRL
jgi:hypothetical protein